MFEKLHLQTVKIVAKNTDSTTDKESSLPCGLA